MAGTNASDDAIEEMARAASYLAEAHARVAAGKILSDVIGLHREVQAPHMTLCYSTSRQPAAPVIAALGRELPGCELTGTAALLGARHGTGRP